MPSYNIVYYISAHGYGHAVRSIEIINKLLDAGVEVYIKTLVPAFLFEEGLIHSAEILPEGFDVGLYQIDNIRFDLKKTKERVKELLASAEKLIQKEQEFLLSHNISGVVCDIPFVPLAAAGRLELPAVGVSNFSWDWIYSYYGLKDPDWNPLVETIRRYYHEGGLLLRLPFYGDMNAFRRIEDVPLVARKSKRERAEIRQALNLSLDRKIGLIGFSSLKLQKSAIKRINQLYPEYLFLFKPPLNWGSSVFKRVEEDEASFVDLICAADLVISKPGYGMVSDCLSHGTPIIYSDRGEFPEYSILVEGIKAHLACGYMPKEDLLSGNWGPYLEGLNQQPRLPLGLRTDGAQVAAERILEYIDTVQKGKK